MTDVPTHLYSACFFQSGCVVPDVKLIEATTDAEAVELALERRMFAVCEVWDRHRLVAVIPSASFH